MTFSIFISIFMTTATRCFWILLVRNSSKENPFLAPLFFENVPKGKIICRDRPVPPHIAFTSCHWWRPQNLATTMIGPYHLMIWVLYNLLLKKDTISLASRGANDRRVSDDEDDDVVLYHLLFQQRTEDFVFSRNRKVSWVVKAFVNI